MFGKNKDATTKPTQVNFKFDLGATVKDTVTGFQGVVMCRSQWLNCCNTYSVQSARLKDGVPQKSVGFGEPQLVPVDEKKTSREQINRWPREKCSIAEKGLR